MGFKSVKKVLVFFVFFSVSSGIFGQESQSKMAVGVSYGFGNALSNTNYSYTNQYLKGQLFYTLTKTRRFEFQIVLAPEINFATHQLLNFYFVTPDEPNFQERRDRFTQLKDIREYVLHVGFLVRKPLSKQFSIYVIGSIGPMITNTETERLSIGFAFSDVLGLGVSFHTKHVTFDFRPNVRHNSNAGLQNSNAGINTLNFEFGVIFPL
jgi:hypothetical protein